MFFCGPAAHVESNLTNDRQSGVTFNAINLGKINARHTVKIAVGIEGYLAAATLAATGSDRNLRVFSSNCWRQASI